MTSARIKPRSKSVITSYSIHYTKLYDAGGAAAWGGFADAQVHLVTGGLGGIGMAYKAAEHYLV